MVALRSVGKVFHQDGQDLEALVDVSFDVEDREIVALVGPSSCGKSTILRLISGLAEPSSGSLALQGRTPAEFRSQGRTGFVFQRPALLPWRTLLDNLLLPAQVKGVDPSISVPKAQRLLGLVGLSSFERAYPHQLSGGMTQRAAFARALMSDPEPALLLLDEPFSATDEITREQIWQDFRAMWSKLELTVILVTHSVTEATFLADRVLVMSPRPGKVVRTVELESPFARTRDYLRSDAFARAVVEVRRAIE